MAVDRTLRLPEIAEVRDRLIPELPVAAREIVDGEEIAITGIIDALCFDENGRPELVIDWKSDVAPKAEAVQHYRAQVKQYLSATSCPKGMIVFVTTGELLTVHA